MARVVEEEGGERIIADGEIVASSFGGRLADENRAIFFAFTADDKFAAVEVDGVAVEAHKFGDAETAGEEEFDDGAIAKARFGVARNGVQ